MNKPSNWKYICNYIKAPFLNLPVEYNSFCTDCIIIDLAFYLFRWILLNQHHVKMSTTLSWNFLYPATRFWPSSDYQQNLVDEKTKSLVGFLARKYSIQRNRHFWGYELTILQFQTLSLCCLALNFSWQPNFLAKTQLKSRVNLKICWSMN